MKVTSSEIEGSQVVLEMEIEPERVEKAMDRAYRRVASRVNIPGFRKGKAPRPLVERMVGRESLLNEALEILVPEAYEEAVQETGIDPVGHPKLDVVSAEPLSVKATVPVRPTVQLGDYRSIRQSEEPVEITEEQVVSTLERLRDSRAQWEKVEREAKAGDLASIDITARTEESTFADSKGVRVVLDTERPILAPGVLDQILGMKEGDRKAFDITLPEDFQQTELAGKEAAVEVSVNEVREKNLPELDDELARAVGDYSSVDELKAAVRTELEAQARAQSRQNLEETVLAAVVDQATVEPPTPWVEEQAQTMRENAERRLGNEGLTFEQFLRFSNMTEASYQEETLTSARRQLKRGLVLDAVADAEAIEPSEEEVEAALQQALASQQGRSGPIDRERTKSNLRSLIREQKTIARLVAIATEAEEGTEPTAEGSVGQESAQQTVPSEEATSSGAAAKEEGVTAGQSKTESET